MRPRTDRNESFRSKSTESEELLRSTSATSEGVGEERPLYPKRDRAALGADRSPEPRPEGPGKGERSQPDAERAP